MLYDLIIVGGGISGLRTAIKALKKRPNIKCLILEKYGYIGGRIVTYRKDIPKVGEVQWENGAGRISTSHKKVLKLFKKYNLTFIPISEDIYYISDPKISDKHADIKGNTFSDLINYYIGPIECLPRDMLAANTLNDLLDMVIGPGSARNFYIQFPYYSEIHTLRADLAIDSFYKEMNSNKGFGVCKEGLGALPDSMMAEFLSRGGEILMNTPVTSVINNPDNTITLKVKSDATPANFTAKMVVLALHHNALKELNSPISSLPVLKHLTMEPLLRMYAVFPVRKGVSWFSGLDKIVTDSHIRYIIPIDAKRGIVMISYTDGKDAKFWFKQGEGKMGEENVKDLVMTEIRRLFPDRTVPDPIFFKQHPWTSGCTYWSPGNYCVEYESDKSLHPLPKDIPNLFMCGESFAVKQCWIESGLEQSDKLLDNREFKGCLKKL
jgi:monoamine oxidase